MTSVSRFEELLCWQKARLLTRQIFQLTRRQKFTDFSLRDQIQRASVSVMANIAEGFERGTRDEFIYFLYIAKGSCGEVRSHLYCALDQGFIDLTDFNNTIEITKFTSSIIYRFIESLKVSGYKGLKSKLNYQLTEAAKFDKELKEKYLSHLNH